jgi:ribosomal protein S6
MSKKELEIEQTEEVLENTKDAVIYELAVHIDPDKTESDARKIFEDLQKGAGSIVAQGEPHKIQLAYTISVMEPSGRHDFNTSYFGWFAYEATTDVHAAVLAKVKDTKAVFRFLDVKVSKEEALEAQELHELRVEETKERAVADDFAEEVVDAEQVVDAELDAALKTVV